MMKKLKKLSNYVLLILLSIGTFAYYRDDMFYFGVKYLSSLRAFDMMFSLMFSFVVFKVFLDNYYYMVLNKINIISRVGRFKYNIIILRILLFHTFLLIFFNTILDFILIGKIKIMLIIFNVILSALIIILLPKRKEYNNEFLMILVISLIIKLIFSNIIL